MNVLSSQSITSRMRLPVWVATDKSTNVVSTKADDERMSVNKRSASIQQPDVLSLSPKSLIMCPRSMVAPATSRMLSKINRVSNDYNADRC
jgi:valyl-tRNA synthetase